MSSYVGRHAELYDIFYQDKPYENEAAFINQCFKSYTSQPIKNILELACGTGTHAFELKKLGYNITATDYSLDMLEVARKKALAAGENNIEFCFQDMRNLELKNNSYDAVICLFDSIGYVLTNQALKQTLQNVYQSLSPGGLFLFEFWHAGAMIKEYDPLRVRRWSIPNGELLRISETSLDIVKQTSRVKYTIYELMNDGSYFKLQEVQENRYFLVQEMNSFLVESGFEPLKMFSGFSFSEGITEDTWHIVSLAQKK